MKGNSAIWLLVGALAFGVGFAGGLLSKSSPTAETPTVPPSAGQRLSGIAPTPQPTEIEIADPVMRARIDFLESLTKTELADLPDLVRGIIPWDSGGRDERTIIPIMDRWIELDPAAGFDYFAAEPEQANWFGRSKFAQRWALIDPDAAVLAGRGRALGSIGRILAKHRPADFFRLHDHGLGHRYIEEAARNSESENVPAMLAALPNFGESAQVGMQADIARCWAADDPGAAVDWVSGLDEGPGKTRAFRALAAALINTDPARAAEFYAIGSQGSQRGEFYGCDDNRYDGEKFSRDQIAGRLAREDPAGAFEWAVAAGCDPASAIGKFVPENGGAIIDYVANLPAVVFEGDEATKRVRRSYEWHPTHIETGLSRIDEIADPRAREVAHTWLLNEQARSDPAAAITATTEKIQLPANRAYLLESAFRSWARSDSAAAAEALAQQAHGSDRDAGIQGFAGAAILTEPELAIQWAVGISEPGLRGSTLFKILRWQPRSWALATLESNGLSETELDSFRRTFESNPWY